MRAATVMGLIVLAAGCTRAHYRQAADRDSYGAIEERNNCPAWQLPRIDITPAPQSRLADPYNPDRPPMPPDDPAADRYMVRANGMRGSKHWHDNGDAPSVEPPCWRDGLPLDAAGILVLTPDRAAEVGLLESREYQSALEDVYLSALALTLNRFDFACHWFLTNDGTFEWFGSGPSETDTYTNTSTFGFTKNFAAGGQLLAEFANAIVVNFTSGHTTVQSDLIGQFIQPLLRGAGRQVRMEGLTQGERSLLYAVRTFARFRKTFWANLTTTNNGFLQLLLQVQNIRNLETNVVTQEQVLRLHEALFAGGIASTVQVDQVYQSYQQARFAVLQAQTALDNSLDSYKIQLGLPPDLPIKLDDSQLAPFQLADPGLVRDQDAAEQLLARYRGLAQPPAATELRAGLDDLRALTGRGAGYAEQIEAERTRWRAKLNDPAAALDPSSHDREEALYKTIGRQLGTTRDGVGDLNRQIDKAIADLGKADPAAAWRQLQILSRQLIALLGELYVAQTQVRVFLIDLPPVNAPPEAVAIAEALADRLDVMNERAAVVDSWRQIAVTANGLEADLNLVLNADIATPLGSRPFNFSAASSTYTAGLQFSGPLNRYAERNIYRTSLINYERTRRDLMALEDNVRQSIRRDLRQIKTDKLGFAIARLTLIAAARQLDGAREELLIAPRGADSATGTLTILNALAGVLSARNALIGSYISYETDRIQLLLDLEALQLDERGIPFHEGATPAPLPDPARLFPVPRADGERGPSNPWAGPATPAG